MTNWFIGQKVVCVNDTAFIPRRGEKCPKKDVVYTIREIHTPPERKRVYLLLAEIVNDKHKYSRYFEGNKIEAGFSETRFRPLVDKKTDISSLEELLVTKKMLLPPEEVKELLKVI
jgi:hypothetical protein